MPQALVRPALAFPDPEADTVPRLICANPTLVRSGNSSIGGFRSGADLGHRRGPASGTKKHHMRIAHGDAARRVKKPGLSIGPTCSSMPRVSISPPAGISFQSSLARPCRRSPAGRPPGPRSASQHCLDGRLIAPRRFQEQPADAAARCRRRRPAAIGVPDAHIGVRLLGGGNADQLIAANPRSRSARSPPPSGRARRAVSGLPRPRSHCQASSSGTRSAHGPHIDAGDASRI